MNITDTKLEKVKNRSAETYKNHIKINLIFIHQKRVKQIFLISALLTILFTPPSMKKKTFYLHFKLKIKTISPKNKQ